MSDRFDRAKLGFEEAKSYYADQHQRMKEDFEFSDPVDPQQWDSDARISRRLSGRPCGTHDYTNQYIMQVVNDYCMNKPSIQALPVGSGTDKEVAQVLEGYFRHIEYASRAGIADETAIQHAARVGLGWTRVVTEVVDPETNEQEIRIKRVHDPLSVMLNPDSTEPDGSDAVKGWVESAMSKEAFKRAWPKSKLYGKDDKGWYSDDEVRVCEYFEVVTKKQNRIVVEIEGERMTLTEAEYWKMVDIVGFKPPVVATYIGEVRTVDWIKYCGDEELESTEFPSRWIPLIPVIGYEIFIDGKRKLCGLTRRMMDGQRGYNVARNAETELAMMSPKQPFMAAAEAIAGHENQWANANAGNKAYLPYNARDESGEPLPVPQRQMPAPVSQGFLQLAQAALGDIEASVGMYRANLGQTSNETSGKAINARQRQGSIANYHYTNSSAWSAEHRGRIIMDMIPKVIDIRRSIQIIGEDGEASSATIDPNQTESVSRRGAKLLAINPNIGRYDIRVKVGPGFATMRQEASEMLGQIMQGNPALASVVGPIWARMQDWPEADKISRMLLAMAPPPVQAAASDEGAQIPPEVQAQLQAAQQQIEQMGQVMQQMQQALEQAEQGQQAEMQKTQMQLQAKMQESQQKSETQIIVEQIKAQLQQSIAAENNETKRAIADLGAAMQLILQGMQPPPALAAEVDQELQERIAT